MIEIIGTSHISPDSIREVKEKLQTGRFDVVAVELDRKRLISMEQEGKPTRASMRNPVAGLISRVQKFLSRKTGITPGSEMLTAVHEAERLKIPVSLIDRDISETIRRIKDIPLLEKIKIGGYLLTGFITSKRLDFKLDEVPDEEMVEDLLGKFRIIFPETYNALIEERNVLMAEKIRYLEERFGNVLTVVGAGHEPGLKELLSEL